MVLLNLPLDMATVMVSSIAIGVGIDFAIHFLSRFRREMELNGDYTQAYEQTMKSAGKGIVFNTLAVAFGFAIMLFSNFKGLANFGLLITITMITSALATFTFVPALLLTLKPRFVQKHATSSSESISNLKPVAQISEVQARINE